MIAWVLIVISRRFLLFHLFTYLLFHLSTFPPFHLSSFLLPSFSTLVLLYKRRKEEKNNSTFNVKYLN
nr:MAG TPA: hypothetical protein [Caudoviricetes sp.]